MRFATRAIHAGQDPDPATGATVLPIHPSSTFTQEAVGQHKGFEYARTGNPTRHALEMCLASLEEAEHGLAFASGMAATNAVLSLLRPGDHVIACDDLYGGTYRLFERVYTPLGLCFSYVDGCDSAAFEAAFRPETRLVWVESPTNPLLHLTDITAVAQVCRERGALLAVDNTFATPYLQRPLTLGAHLVVHSTTKYIGGHSDVVGGAVLTSSSELHQMLKFHQNAVGAVPSPFDCWLTLRGLKTLSLRMRQHQENAQLVAEFLASHPAVARVHYPGLSGFPQRALAARQMAGPGGMVSLELAGGAAQAQAFLCALSLFSLAESLGGVESLACYPQAMTHASVPPKRRARLGITPGLVRLSVGIEDVGDLVADLAHALEVAAEVGTSRHRAKSRL